MIKLILAFLCGVAVSAVEASEVGYGPSAALAMDLRYRGDCCTPGVLHCYPAAHGVPFADCRNILPMTPDLWTPGQLCADFRRRMSDLPARDRKKGILVLLKTERCATKAARACTITTAALEKRSTPLAGEFLIYGVQLKPRDHDNPPGRLAIETGMDAWKNRAAGQYRFEQGPGATLVFLNPNTGAKVATTNASKLDLLEWDFFRKGGHTPELHRLLADVLLKLRSEQDHRRMRSKLVGPEDA